MILGGLVIVVVGILVTNYFRETDSINDISDGVSTEISETQKVHTVKEGEDLWKISEKYYDDGYEWPEIAKANEIADPNTIESGQKLVIPEMEENNSIEEVDSNTSNTEEKVTENIEENVKVNTKMSTEKTYTVQKGDSLWKIAQNAYGNAYRWTDIAKANNLANPDIIHSGNVLQLPE